MEDNTQQTSDMVSEAENYVKLEQCALDIDENKIQQGTTFNKEYWHRKSTTRKSAYVIAVISQLNFVKYGASKINHGIYVIKKEYDGSPTKETCALVGIPARLINNFITNDSEIINYIKQCDEFKYIDQINFITTDHVYKAIIKFRIHFNNCDDTDLILLNIEPKGYGRFEKRYPVPRFTIPGGTMEKNDDFSFESCGFREFQEETGFDIRHCHEKISRGKIRSGNRFTFMDSFQKHLQLLPGKRRQEILKQVESMYYFVKIK